MKVVICLFCGGVLQVGCRDGFSLNYVGFGGTVNWRIVWGFRETSECYYFPSMLGPRLLSTLRFNR